MRLSQKELIREISVLAKTVEKTQEWEVDITLIMAWIA